MKYYLFLLHGTLIWTSTNEGFNEMIANPSYKYMGTVTSDGISMGPNIEPYKGRNLPTT